MHRQTLRARSERGSRTFDGGVSSQASQHLFFARPVVPWQLAKSKCSASRAPSRPLQRANPLFETVGLAHHVAGLVKRMRQQAHTLEGREQVHGEIARLAALSQQAKLRLA